MSTGNKRKGCAGTIGGGGGRGSKDIFVSSVPSVSKDIFVPSVPSVRWPCTISESSAETLKMHMYRHMFSPFGYVFFFHY